MKLFGQVRVNTQFRYDKVDYVKMKGEMIESENRSRLVNACQLHTRNFRYFSDRLEVEVFE